MKPAVAVHHRLLRELPTLEITIKINFLCLVKALLLTNVHPVLDQSSHTNYYVFVVHFVIFDIIYFQ